MREGFYWARILTPTGSFLEWEVVEVRITQRGLRVYATGSDMAYPRAAWDFGERVEKK